MAYARYLKTGEDPEGQFRNASNNNDQEQNERQQLLQQQQQQQSRTGSGAVMVDPNDELKPLPGDKARIVRSREERIGVGGGGTASGNPR